MYFANAEGVLIYDGLTWNMVQSSNESGIRSLDVSPSGMVYVGAVGDFGYLSVDDFGKQVFVSLRRLYNLDPQEIQDVYSVNAFEDGVYFMTKKNVFFYDGKSLKIWESETEFQSAYNLNGQYIVNQMSTGLCRLIKDSIVPLSQVTDFKNIKIVDIVSYSENDHFVFTENNGIKLLYRKSENKKGFTEYTERIDRELSEYQLTNGLLVNDEILSIGTWGYGLLLVDREGRIVQRVNSDYDLNDDVINDQFLDKEGNLWLATSNGISVVSFNSRISKYGGKANINETVEDITVFDNKVFTATHTGLFYWDKGIKSGEFKKVQGFDRECWGLLPFKFGKSELLLVAENNALYQVDKELSVQRITDCYPWTIHQYSKDSSIVFVGLDDGLLCLSYIEGSWEVKEKIPGIDYAVNSIVEAEENILWLGSPGKATKLTLEWIRSIGTYRFKIKSFNQNDGLPAGDVCVEMMGDQLMFGTSEGIYSFSEDNRKFNKEKDFDLAFQNRPFQVHRLAYQYPGKLWMSAYFDDKFYLGYFRDDRTGLSWVDNDFLPFSSEVYHSIFHDDDEISWLGGPEGLLKFQGTKKSNEELQTFEVLIRSVVLNNDSVYFHGNEAGLNYGDSVLKAGKAIKLSYDYNSIRFNFSSTYYKYPLYNQYSVKLEGFDKQWSEWSNESKAVFTNLYEGEYTFLVKSRNAYGQESGISEYVFDIDPPWFRSWWAYLIYIVSTVLLVFGIVSMYTQNLKEIIREKTREVVFQKDEIERQKNAVEFQRQELELKNADITSSINYAKRLQHAILPESSVIKQHLPNNFILYKPKDIVSGDFYWMDHVNGATGHDLTLFATVDCTGHGVPGAFVSIVGNGGLHRAVKEFGLVEPAQILEKLNEIVIETLSKGENDIRDGMDISLCSFDFGKMEMQFAGANNSAYLVRKNVVNADLSLNGHGRFFKNDLLEIKANKQPVGYYEFREAFVNHKIKLEKGDMIYLFSDGFPDQFGGPESKKYNYPRFKEFLLSISEKPMEEQKALIDAEFNKWRGREEQIDDIIVAGIKI